MRSEWLEAFADTVRLGSIKASADKHCISPQGLSKSIRSLEQELGVALFERGANSVSLTPEGAQLLPRIKKAVEAIGLLKGEAAALASGEQAASVCMLCSTFVFLCGMMAPLQDALKSFERPTMFVQTSTDRMFDILAGKTVEDVCRGKVLCGIPLFFSSAKKENAERLRFLSVNGYAYEPLIEYSDGILVSKNHPLADAGYVTKDDLRSFPVVISNVEQGDPISRYLGSSHISAVVSNMASRLRLIEDGQSVIFVPPFIDAVCDERYRFVSLGDIYRAGVGFVYDRTHLTSEEVAPLLLRLACYYRAFEDQGTCQVTARETLG